jgi:hypothetical protein
VRRYFLVILVLSDVILAAAFSTMGSVIRSVWTRDDLPGNHAADLEGDGILLDLGVVDDGRLDTISNDQGDGHVSGLLGDLNVVHGESPESSGVSL